MYRLWWQLPGPSQFVSRIVSDLRDGKNVFIGLPEHFPDGLAGAVRAALGDSESWHWVTLRLSETDRSEDPAHLLFSRFVPDTPLDAIQNANTLAQEESFTGHVIWLDELTEDTWGSWKRFITEYEHACRSCSLLFRTLFCVPLIGKLALDAPAEEVCLSHRCWRGVVNELDMLLFTSSRFQGKRLPDLQKRVAVSVIANIALWDAFVSERLVHENLRRILNPAPILQEIARERGWSSKEDDPSLPSWHRGMIDMVNGQEKTHSAALAGRDAFNEIDRRIWSAEVGVILPFVEERRQEILNRLLGILTVPFTTRFGEVITDLRDLEIGHIKSQIGNNRLLVSSDMRQLVWWLREIRNSLAHFEPLRPELLLDDKVSRFINS